MHFAIVLFTADDLGRSKNSTELKPRARQNVLFELGYFVGHLGIENVCILYETGVEILSDYQGVLFIQLDNEGKWKSDLAKELKAANIEVALNKLYS